MFETEARKSPWVRVQKADPKIEIRETRPAITPPSRCPFGTYDKVYRPMKHEYEGACRNYDMNRLQCVYCAAALMSNALLKIPYDVRARCDETMGW